MNNDTMEHPLITKEKEKRTILGKAVPLATPLRLSIDVSEVCNIKCSYCFRSMNHSAYGYALDSGVMSMDIVDAIIQQLKSFPDPVKIIGLSGSGEPLVNKNFPQIVGELKQHIPNSFIDVISNGLLLTPSLMDALIESGLDKIIISLQGLSGKKYKDVCGATIDFDAFVSNIAYFHKHSKTTQIWVKIIDVALDEGEEALFHDMFKEITHNHYIEKEQDLWNADSDQSKLSQQTRLEEVLEFQNTCPQSFSILFINPKGDIYPCCNPLCPVSFGNVKKTSLIKAFNSKKRTEFLKAQLKHSRESMPICNHCNFAQNYVRFVETDSLNGYETEILSRMEENILE